MPQKNSALVSAIVL